ncbi:MAG: hypothetical protein OEY63_08560 [Gemmatimonadota bacterium]|nr:hypothetical protein [Gemmatimonadota bacterium]
MRTRVFTVLSFVAAILSVASSASGQMSDVRVGASGTVHYSRTNGNVFSGGTEEGNYRNSGINLALNASAEDRLRFSVVAFWGQDLEENAVEIDVAWAEYSFSDALALRAGRSRVPYGAYGEVLELGVARPFITLPKGIYGPAGIVAEWYQGAGITGSVFTEGGWGVQYDAFLGHMEFEEESNYSHLFGMGHMVEVDEVNDIFGAHLTVDAPVPGLRFGAGGFSGVMTHMGNIRHNSFIGSAEYLTGEVHFRSEVAYHNEDGDDDVTAYYAEAAYRLESGLQFGVRYEGLDAAGPAGVDTSGAPTVLNHQDFGITANYWFSSMFVMKSSVHFTSGNFFSGPEGIVDFLAGGGTLNDKTTSFLVGAQFAF